MVFYFTGPLLVALGCLQLALAGRMNRRQSADDGAVE